MEAWFGITLLECMTIMLSALLFYVGLIIIVRINGLRSFSKISSHDFAVTIAIGSIFASTVVMRTPHLTQGLLAVATLLLLNTIASRIRRVKSNGLVDNHPLILMDGPIMIEENLKKANITESDIYAKLREANVLNFKQIRAVVMESTGDISILHGKREEFDPTLLNGCKK